VSGEFGTRLRRVLSESGQLCVGIDPHQTLLREWNLPDSAQGARDLGLRVVDAAVGRVGLVKPQIAFFERFGSAGYAALEDVLSSARSAGLVVIGDVKRGDVGSTADAYGEAWLSPGSSLEVDAMTAVAYQGLGSLDGVLGLAERHDKGVFVLAATSNPEARVTQMARRADGRTVAGALVDDVVARNADPLGSLGVVVGATVALPDFGLSTGSFRATPILAPGFGHQGALIARLPELFGEAAQNVVVNASRSILAAGPHGLVAAIDAHRAEVDACRA
jgi:orotidine-5'-phosphate decarboxylase